MIISASYRTDIPAFYADWFCRRLAAGSVKVVNPYGGPPSTVALTAQLVSGFVFWTRNAGSFLPALTAVRAQNTPFLVQYTITGYPRALDAATIAADRAADQIVDIVSRFGAGTVVWRYDPVVFSSLTPPEWHQRSFLRLCQSLRPVVDEVIVSFAHIYRKSERNMTAAARAFGFRWWDPPADEKRALLRRFQVIAAENGLALSLCGQPDLLVDGVRPARCIDAERLSRLAGRTITVPQKAHRPTCECFASRDIGAYDSCPQGCVYCYAVASRTLAKQNYGRHDPQAEFLIPPVASQWRSSTFAPARSPGCP
jgi:hypothetical protein